MLTTCKLPVTTVIYIYCIIAVYIFVAVGGIMLSSIKNKLNIVRVMLFIVALAAALSVYPVTVRAEDGEDEGQLIPDAILFTDLDILRAGGQLMILFMPMHGTFPESEAVLQGIRFVDIGQSLLRSDFPPDPSRYGYFFDGWQFENGAQIEGDIPAVNDHIRIHAIWRPYSYGPANTHPPTTTTPPPTTTPTQSPTPAITPSPTPPPSQGAAAPNPNNPTTSPLAISLMIFAAVAGLGTAAFGIITLYMRHNMAVEQYNASAKRYKRESRLEAMLWDDDDLK